jgi:multidrug efflux pump
MSMPTSRRSGAEQGQQALPRLPQQVQQQGLTVTKSNADFLMVVSIYDESDRLRSGDVPTISSPTCRTRSGACRGSATSTCSGSQYAMRIWLDPYKLASFALIPAGRVERDPGAEYAGRRRAGRRQPLAGRADAQRHRDRPVAADEPEQFRQIILKTQPDGSRVVLEDVARVELGSESYNNVSRLNGHPGAGIAIQLAPGADALQTADLVRAEIAERSKSFPSGFRYAFPNDSTAFIRLSINEVVKTLIEAIILVVIVMFLFLQSWRATLIPTIAVPVVLLGTFGILALFGYSINTLTLFGLVLSIGLLVDDADRRGRECRAPDGRGEARRREARSSRWRRSRPALIAIALVLSRCSCRWRSSAGRSASSIASSRSPSCRRWCCRSWCAGADAGADRDADEAAMTPCRRPGNRSRIRGAVGGSLQPRLAWTIERYDAGCAP